MQDTEIEAQLAELEAKRRMLLEQKRLNALNAPVTISVLRATTHAVTVKLDTPRNDVLDILRTTPGRLFFGDTQENTVPLTSWREFADRIAALKNVKLTFDKTANENILKYFNNPDFKITAEKNRIVIACHPQAFTDVISRMEGAILRTPTATDFGYVYVLPLGEAWRLVEPLREYKRPPKLNLVEWDSKVLELAEDELRRRIALDTIALKRDSDINIPLKEGELRGFQKVGVEFFIHANGIAANCDQMGLGKTVQTIAYNEYINGRMVVVCPAHLKTNWAREIVKWTGYIPVILRGREPDQFVIKELLADKPRYVIINYDIIGSPVEIPESVITDEQGIKHVKPKHTRYLWPELLNMTSPDIFVLDEAHYIKTSDAKRSIAVRQLSAPKRIGLTGTPILNRPGEFWPLLNWLHPELFPKEERFKLDYTIDGKLPRNVDRLRELLRPIMIRRLKADVVAELPPIERITRYFEMEPHWRAKYEKVLQGVYSTIDEVGNEVEKNITSILAELNKLREVCSLAKTQATASLALELLESEDTTGAKKGNNKVLIFAYYKEAVEQIAKALGKAAISWTGETAQDRRTELEDRFQTDDSVKFLVVSLMTGQTGLNLTAAGHVIFNDLWWTPAAHAQAEERAYGRLSNLHGCDSYYHVAENSIEVDMMELLGRKLQIINAVVEGIDAERDSGIAMAIITKLKEMRRK